MGGAPIGKENETKFELLCPRTHLSKYRIISSPVKTLSETFLPLINASSETILGKRGFIHLHKSPENILLTKLHRLIGRKSPKVTWLYYFGSKTKEVLPMLLGIGALAKKSRIAIKRSCAMISTSIKVA